MNAKQISVELVSACLDVDESTRLMLETDCLRRIVLDAGAKAKRGNNSIHAVTVAFREAFGLWKAIVRRVREADPKAGLSDQYFGILMAVTSPELYEILMSRNALLGYEPSEKEKQILADRKLSREFDARMQALMMESLRDVIFRAAGYANETRMVPHLNADV